MGNPRTLKLVIELEDDGEPDTYMRIMDTLRALGAEVIDEEEV